MKPGSKRAAESDLQAAWQDPRWPIVAWFPRSSEPALFLTPLRQPAGGPGGARGAQGLLQPGQVGLNQLAQLAQLPRELVTGRLVLLALRRRRGRQGQPLLTHNGLHALRDRRWRVLIASTQGLVATQGAEDVAIALLQFIRDRPPLLRERGRDTDRALDLLQAVAHVVGSRQRSRNSPPELGELPLEGEQGLPVSKRGLRGALHHHAEFLSAGQRRDLAAYPLRPGDRISAGHDQRTAGRF